MEAVCNKANPIPCINKPVRNNGKLLPLAAGTNITEPTAILITPVITNASCVGGDGSVDITVTGGTGYIDGGDLTISNLNSPQFHKLSYVHDDVDTFWIMPIGMWSWYWPNFGMNINAQRELASKFNLQFAGKASMIAGNHTYSGFPGYFIVSTVDPQNGRLIFTTVEPFGRLIFDKLKDQQ